VGKELLNVKLGYFLADSFAKALLNTMHKPPAKHQIAVVAKLSTP